MKTWATYFNNAISELFDMMSFAEIKTCFESFRDKKKNEEWIDLFMHKIAELKGMEEIECHDILSTLYYQQCKFNKMKYHDEKSEKLKSLLTK